MADRQESDREVLTSLPRTRPVRRSAKRAERAPAKAAAKVSPATRAAANAPAARAKAKPPRAGAPASGPRATGERPSVAPARKVPPAGYAVPRGRGEERAAPGPAALVGTMLQAAAELAQIGVTIGRQTLQSMLDRLPRP